MDKTGSTSTLAPKTVNRQFFQWAVKWFYANATEDISTKPDIPSMICLFQAIGFKLREFEKGDQLIPTSDPLKNGNVRITMKCGSSKMIAVLEMDDVLCECPDTNEAKDGSFWSITGTGPMSSSMNNVSRVEETGSNLVPEMSKETTAVVRDVAHRLFKLINNNGDINQNKESDLNIPSLYANNTITKSSEIINHGLVRSYTDIYDSNYTPRTSARVTSNLVSAKFTSTRSVIKESTTDLSKQRKLNRQGTYELDENENDEPRPSPPKIASSPVLNHLLCTSLGQLSLQSDDELVGLADYVVKAHQILDKAVNYILKKLPPSNLSQSSIPEEREFVKPAPPPLMSSSFCVSNSPRNSTGSNSLANRSMSSGSSSRPGSACSMPARVTQPTTNRSIASVQKPLARRSVAGTTNNTMTSSMPPMRDRASSFSATQRPTSKQLASPKKGAGSLTGPSRRKSATTGASGTAQRTTPTSSRLPASKLGLAKNTSSSLSAALTSKSQGNTSITAPRANLSFIKAPSTASRHSTLGTSSANTSISKFGFSAAKK